MEIVEIGKGTIKHMKKRENLILSEDKEQELLVQWMEMSKIRFYAIPNGGKRSLTQAIKFKRTGVKAGVPDICIPVPSKRYHGLYIEMKRSDGGTVSINQAEWLHYLQSAGYKVSVCHGFEQGKSIVEKYLQL